MEKDENVVVKNSQPRALHLSSPDFTLIPGENNVPKSVLQENINNPNGVVKSWFNLNYLGIVKGVKTARPLAEDLGAVNATRAIEIVSKAENTQLLKTWSTKESRSTVLRAITKRLAELAPKKESSED